jgi:hypothetical protein
MPHADRELQAGHSVAAVVHHVSTDLLGGHVPHRAHHRPCRRELRLRGRPGVAARGGCRLDGETEVEDLDARSGEEEALRLEVAVRDATFVHRGQTRRDLTGYGDRLAAGERAAFEPLAETLAVEQFHHGVVELFLPPEIVAGEDVRMGERRDGPHLTLKACTRNLIVRDRIPQHLDGNLAVEACIPRPVDLPHSPRAERGKNLAGPSRWPVARSMRDSV